MDNELAEFKEKVLKRLKSLEKEIKHLKYQQPVKQLGRSLVKRTPTKRIKAGEAAKRIGCSSKSIRTGRIGSFKLYRLTDKPTSPLYVLEADVEKFIQERFGR